ncbi:MAG: hypothetical protein QOE45_2047 [Frankiaceae bacterium]|nr:hypothetical protein [Frankiaceae bacterium]
MPGHLDPGAFTELMAESADLHADAMRSMRQPLDEIVALGKERQAARAAAANDAVMALQTAASLENLAVLAYRTALTLPYLKNPTGTAFKTVAAFAQTTMAQHTDHGKAFNAKAKELGGAEQTGTDPKYTPVVANAVPQLKKGNPLDLVDLAMTLEDVATSTYVKNIQTLTDPTVRLLFGTVAGVESQHLATLIAVKALLSANAPALVTVKATGGAVDVFALPAAAGSAPVPETFKKTELASPFAEGAVQ